MYFKHPETKGFIIYTVYIVIFLIYCIIGLSLLHWMSDFVLVYSNALVLFGSLLAFGPFFKSIFGKCVLFTKLFSLHPSLPSLIPSLPLSFSLSPYLSPSLSPSLSPISPSLPLSLSLSGTIWVGGL